MNLENDRRWHHRNRRNETRFGKRHAAEGWRFNGGMPALTRRRSKDASEECWHVYYGDVRVGTIAIRSGNPFATDPWQWRCAFYPGSLPGDCTSGTAASYGEARDAFELA
jgi:hypothetical protein